MKSRINQLIKFISVILVTSALSLDCYYFYWQSQGKYLPENLNSLFWLGNIILTAHSVEAVIATIKARSGDRNPLVYGLYTFFVGFVGLKELSNE